MPQLTLAVVVEVDVELVHMRVAHITILLQF